MLGAGCPEKMEEQAEIKGPRKCEAGNPGCTREPDGKKEDRRLELGWSWVPGLCEGLSEAHRHPLR